MPLQKADGVSASGGEEPITPNCSPGTSRDYRRLFDRVTLDLGVAGADLPTDQRLKTPDPSLAALYFQFGRYLMIAGSRPGGQPLNLQGIWNDQVIPPWACQYTLNINAEMNYWPAEVCNLSECSRAVAADDRRVGRRRPPRGRTTMYGRRGWVAHHNTTLWRDAQPVDNAAQCAFWPMGSGWLCQHLFEHYRFTGDRDFLEQQAYPLMKDACLFYLDWLVDNGKGQLVTPVSTSPENAFPYTDASGSKAAPASARAARWTWASSATCSATRSAPPRSSIRMPSSASTLKSHARQAAAVPDRRPRAVAGMAGGLRRDRRAPPARFAPVRPLSRATRSRCAARPQLAAAAKRTLELRGDGGTGWSKAWKISFWARLPRQFHVGVIENSNVKHTRTAMWLTPLYLLAINVFVVPIAFAALTVLPKGASADTSLLGLPLLAGQQSISLLVFVGGFSAAAGMIMVETMTMATMMSNHLFLPIIDGSPKLWFLRRHLLSARWVFATVFILAAFGFVLTIGKSYMLVSIGMLSFAAVLQLAPASLGGLFWKQGSRIGAMLGLAAGFVIWNYTLLMPTFVKSGWMGDSILKAGPWGVAALRPTALFGLEGVPSLTHGVLWTLIFNIGLYVAGSVFFPATAAERRLAEAFVTPERNTDIGDVGEATMSAEPQRANSEKLLAQYFRRQRRRRSSRAAWKEPASQAKTELRRSSGPS